MSRVTEIPTRNRVLTVVLDEDMEPAVVDGYKVMIGLLRGVVSVGETRITAAQQRELMSQRRAMWDSIVQAMRQAHVHQDPRPKLVCPTCAAEQRGSIQGLRVLRGSERCDLHPDVDPIDPAGGA